MFRWTGSRLALAAGMAALGMTLSGTPASALSLFPRLHMPWGRTFNTQVQLQALYDEMGEVYTPAVSRTDLRLFDQTVYAPGWKLTDTSGRQFTLAQVNARGVNTTVPDSTVQRIDRLVQTPSGVTTVVTVSTVRLSRTATGSKTADTVARVTRYRDTWVKVGGRWLMQSRTQIAPARTVRGQPQWSNLAAD